MIKNYFSSLLSVSFILLFSGVLCPGQALSDELKSPDVRVEETAVEDAPNGDFVAFIEMDMMIAPGTQSFLDTAIASAEEDGAAALVVKLDTPGGMLNTTQEMVQSVFKSAVPIIFYVSPSGGTATSAGVFITLSAHVAAMAPGTSIGAATPIMGSGEDIKGDLKNKAMQMTQAMVRAIGEQRGRNTDWAEKAVTEASSVTETEALELKVIDFIAEDTDELLSKIEGQIVKLEHRKVRLKDLSKLPRREYGMSFRDQAVNTLANPSVLAVLWLAATTGITLELYNPGAVIPGVIGVICLLLALSVSSVIPVSQGAIMLLVLGSALLVAEVYFTSGILGAGGIIAIILGTIYLVDVSIAPGMQVSLAVIIPALAVAIGLFAWMSKELFQAKSVKRVTGREGLVGSVGEAFEPISSDGLVMVDGSLWSSRAETGIISKGERVEVLAVEPGMKLLVRALESKVQ
jgi:membrane-bound serine protease (ClpP class)